MRPQHGAQEHVHIPGQLGARAPLCREDGLLAASGTAHHGCPPRPLPPGGETPQ